MKRILIVDDDKNILLVYQLDIGIAFDEIEIDCALNALTALSLLRSDKYYDAIITDISMPGMGGLEFLTQVQSMIQKDEIKKVPIIVNTSYSNFPSFTDSQAVLFADYFITKTGDFSELFSALESCLFGENIRFPKIDKSPSQDTPNE